MTEKGLIKDELLQGGAAKAQVTVEVTRLGQSEALKDEALHIEVAPLVTYPAYVTFGAGVTKGTGVKYEFLRLDVRLSMPCYREEIDQVYPQVKDWVDKRMLQEITEFEAQKGRL